MRHATPSAAIRRAFTLVELLVVIGIIAVLIGILLPVLGKAREAGYRVKCASSLRQLGMALVTYAAENKDSCPLGLVATPKTQSPPFDINAGQLELWWTYDAYWSNSNGQRVTGMGILAGSRLLRAGQTFYCPREERERLSYNTPTNLWAFDSTGNLKSGLTGHCYLGYCFRPYAAFPGVPQTNHAAGADTPATIEGYYFGAGTEYLRKGWTKYSSLRNRALLADVARGPIDVKLRHKDGINVYYGSGAVKFVRMSDFEKAGVTQTGGGGPFGGTPTTVYPWKQQTWISSDGAGSPSDDTQWSSNKIYLNTDPKSPGLWNLLDRAI